MKVNMKSLVKPEMCSVQHRLELALHNILRDYNQIAPVHKQGRAAGYRKVTVRKSKLFNNFRRKITAQRNHASCIQYTPDKVAALLPDVFNKIRMI